MIRELLLQARLTVAFGAVAVFMASPFQATNALAQGTQGCATGVVNEYANYEAAEKGTSNTIANNSTGKGANPFQIFYTGSQCDFKLPQTDAFNNPDPTGSFTISYPSSLPGPGCAGFHFAAGNTQKQNTCYFDVTLAPTQTGPLSTAISAMVPAGVGVLVFNLYGAGFTLSPETRDNNNVDHFPLMYSSPPSPGFGSITIDPGNADIIWSGQLFYMTSGGALNKAPSIPIATFTAIAAPYTIGFGTPGSQPTPSPIGGGKLNLTSSYVPPGGVPSPLPSPSVPNTMTSYVVGIPSSEPSPGIPYESITSELTNLYTGLSIPNTDPNFVISGSTTAALLTQIAMQESGAYQQFENPPFENAKQVGNPAYYPYGIIDSWPQESLVTPQSPVRGSHIGLMQVKVTQQDAWNWIQNANDGLNVFQTSINAAYRLADDEYTNFTGVGPPTKLPALTACQLEEMALALYGPDGGKLESQQYLAPKCVGGSVTNTTNCSGTWQWTINNPGGDNKIKKKERAAVCYVFCVRKKAHPGIPPGSSSACSGTPPLPDPPTGLKCGC